MAHGTRTLEKQAVGWQVGDAIEYADPGDGRTYIGIVSEVACAGGKQVSAIRIVWEDDMPSTLFCVQDKRAGCIRKIC